MQVNQRESVDATSVAGASMRVASCPVALQPIREVRAVLDGRDLDQSGLWFEALLRPEQMGGYPDLLSYIRRHIHDHNELLIDAAAIEACEDIASCLDSRCKIGINVFASSLECPAFFAQFLLPRLRKMADQVEICLELSELTEVRSRSALECSLRQLREHGIQIALDDLGAGCCHLQLLGNGLIDVVKLDCAFSLDIDRSERARALVRHLVGYCHETGSTLVLEGIEHLHTLVAADALGVEWAQGYALGRPRLFQRLPEV